MRRSRPFHHVLVRAPTGSWLTLPHCRPRVSWRSRGVLTPVPSPLPQVSTRRPGPHVPSREDAALHAAALATALRDYACTVAAARGGLKRTVSVGATVERDDGG
jgi:hypothetical protein